MCGFSICFFKSRLYPDSKHEGLNILTTASACFHSRARTHARAHTHTLRSICTTPMVCTISLNVGGGHRATRGFQLTLLLTVWLDNATVKKAVYTKNSSQVTLDWLCVTFIHPAYNGSRLFRRRKHLSLHQDLTTAFKTGFGKRIKMPLSVFIIWPWHLKW